MIGLVPIMSRDREELKKILSSYEMFKHRLQTCIESERAIIESALIALGAAMRKKMRDIDANIPGRRE